ncbi:MAG: hypothetical protein E6K80_13145, partial [Candidatus Eisenbacteria bacterium]
MRLDGATCGDGRGRPGEVFQHSRPEEAKREDQGQRQERPVDQHRHRERRRIAQRPQRWIQDRGAESGAGDQVPRHHSVLPDVVERMRRRSPEQREDEDPVGRRAQADDRLRSTVGRRSKRHHATHAVTRSEPVSTKARARDGCGPRGETAPRDGGGGVLIECESCYRRDVRIPEAAVHEPVVGRVHELIDWSAARFGDAPFLFRWTPEGWRAIRYRDAARAVHAFARHLAAHGVGPGAQIGLQSENRPEWGLAYLAALEAGATVVPLDMQLTREETSEILATAEASHCIVSERSRATVEDARRARLPALRLVTLDEHDGLPSWPEAQRRFPDATPLGRSGSADDVVALLFTSGTTGRAKGVMLTHANLLHNVEAVAQAFEFGPEDRMLSVLPLHHTFECTGGLLCPLRIGASVAYARGLKSSELREDLASSGATILLGVPLLYEKLLAGIHRGIAQTPPPRRALAHALLAITREVRRLTGNRVGRSLLRPLRRRAGLERLRLLVSGAAALPVDVFWGLTDLGLTMLEGYGLTECSPVVAANRPPRPEPCSVGWPLPGVSVRIDAPDEEGDGEILVRGPNV